MTAESSAPASIRLVDSRYGKAAVRVVRVIRSPGGDRVRDLTVRIALEGDFEAVHTAGDNAACIATDTMKNTAYAVAKEHLAGAPEQYGLALARHFLGFGQVARATVWLAEHRWARLATPDGPSDHAFLRRGDVTRTAVVVASRDAETVEAGVDELAVLKTTHSGFAGFPRDEFTTLPETDDRLLATKVTATWRYAPTAAATIDHDATWEAVLATLLEVFATHHSPSVQASIWQMGRTALERHAALEEIHFALPNLHHWLADLERFGTPNDREVYVATSEPHGLIEATIRRETT